MPRDDAIAEDPLVLEAEPDRPVRDERVELDERSRIEEQLQSLARGQLAPGVLPLDPLLPAAQERLCAHLLEPLESVAVGRHVLGSSVRTRSRLGNCLCAQTGALRAGVGLISHHSRHARGASARFMRPCTSPRPRTPGRRVDDGW